MSGKNGPGFRLMVDIHMDLIYIYICDPYVSRASSQQPIKTSYCPMLMYTCVYGTHMYLVHAFFLSSLFSLRSSLFALVSPLFSLFSLLSSLCSLVSFVLRVAVLLQYLSCVAS